MFELTIIIIALLSIMVIGQIFFILSVIKRAGTERMSLINLHKEHLSTIEEQRDLYRELLDSFIEKHLIQDELGNSIANWCPTCQEPSLIKNNVGDIHCSICNKSPKVTQ